MDGKALAGKVRAEVTKEVEELGPLGLATILVGDDPASDVYVTLKHKDATEVGMRPIDKRLPADTSEADVLALVEELNTDEDVDGLLVQTPVPEHLDEFKILSSVLPVKDVDGLTPRNAGLLYLGRNGHVGATPLGVMRLLQRYGVETSGRRAVIVGRSTLVGLPLALLLARKGVDATVTVAHSRTPDLAGVCREADILIGAAGQARMLTVDYVKPGAAVVDVGVSRTETGVVGDVDQAAVAEVAGWLTPMPGGTGPMTIACLLENTVVAARLQGTLD